MTTTGSVYGFRDFEELCQGYQGYSDNLAQLFVKTNHYLHPITYTEAKERLKTKVNETLQTLEINSSRRVTEFVIGKTFVNQRQDISFDPMNKTTWSINYGINSRWRDYKKEGFDGLVVIGCIVRELIPFNVLNCNKSMNLQMYTLGLEQALIQHYMLEKPDSRLRNKSLSIGNLSEKVHKGGIVYVAYKLEQNPNEEFESHFLDEFQGFTQLCNGCRGYSYNLVELFDETNSYPKITFKEKLERLMAKVDEIMHALTYQSSRNVTELSIGKMFVKKRLDVDFDPMNISTWCIDGGINFRWQTYKNEGYDGLVVIGCIVRDLIPNNVMQCNKSINMNQQMYTLGLEQALIQHYMYYEIDSRLRINSYNMVNILDDESEGGIVYIAYKLESELQNEADQDSTSGVNAMPSTTCAALLPQYPFVVNFPPIIPLPTTSYFVQQPSLPTGNYLFQYGM